MFEMESHSMLFRPAQLAVLPPLLDSPAIQCLMPDLTRRLAAAQICPPAISVPELAVELLRFLRIKVALGDTSATYAISPPEVIDEAWHALLMDTILYNRVCAALGVAALHHCPDQEGGGEGLKERRHAALGARAHVAAVEFAQGRQLDAACILHSAQVLPSTVWGDYLASGGHVVQVQVDGGLVLHAYVQPSWTVSHLSRQLYRLYCHSRDAEVPCAKTCIYSVPLTPCALLQQQQTLMAVSQPGRSTTLSSTHRPAKLDPFAALQACCKRFGRDCMPSQVSAVCSSFARGVHGVRSLCCDWISQLILVMCSALFAGWAAVHIHDAEALQLDDTTAQSDATKAQLDETAVQVDELRAELETSLARPTATSAQPDTSKAQMDETVAQVDELRAELEKPLAWPAATSAQPNATKAQMDVAVAQVDELRAQPKAPSPAQLDQTPALPTATSAQLAKTPAWLVEMRAQQPLPNLQLDQTQQQQKEARAQPDQTSARLIVTPAQPAKSQAQQPLPNLQLDQTQQQQREARAQPDQTSARLTVTPAQPAKSQAQQPLPNLQLDQTQQQQREAQAQPDRMQARLIVTPAQPDVTPARPDQTSARLNAASAQPDKTSVQPAKSQTQQQLPNPQLHQTQQQQKEARAQPDQLPAQLIATPARPDVTPAQPNQTPALPTATSAQPDKTSVQPAESRAQQPLPALQPNQHQGEAQALPDQPQVQQKEAQAQPDQTPARLDETRAKRPTQLQPAESQAQRPPPMPQLNDTRDTQRRPPLLQQPTSADTGDTAKLMEVFVKRFDINIGMNMLVFRVSRDLLVEGLKGLIRQQIGLAPDRQRLMFGGHILQPWKNLRMCNIRDHSTLHLTDDAHVQRRPPLLHQPTGADTDTAKLMQVFVRGLDGKMLVFRVSRDLLVLRLMELIRDKIGLSPDAQRLLYSSRQLQPWNTLRMCKIQEDSTLYLMCRLRGC